MSTVDLKARPYAGVRGPSTIAIPISMRRPAAPVHVPWRKTVIYEMHVEGFTAKRTVAARNHCPARTPDSAHPTTLAYLQGLGITSIELLPILAKQDDSSARTRPQELLGLLHSQLLRPEPSYAISRPGEGRGRRAPRSHGDMLRVLYEAGFEVIMDVVCTTTHAKAASKA